jgi:hypothetical protein
MRRRSAIKNLNKRVDDSCVESAAEILNALLYTIFVTPYKFGHEMLKFKPEGLIEILGSTYMKPFGSPVRSTGQIRNHQADTV